MLTREEFIKNQHEHCKEKEAPFFMPGNGFCYCCHKDIVPILIARGHTGSDELVTGCPICFRSYCD
jgi:hypothetical protein